MNTLSAPAAHHHNDPSNDLAVVHPKEWGPGEVIAWLRGVLRLSREQLDALHAKGWDGPALLKLTDADLQPTIDTFGERHRVLSAVQILKELDAYLKTTCVSLLGTQLLLAGRTIDEKPLAAVADMGAALTHALFVLDKKPPDDQEQYLAIRKKLLDQTAAFIDVAQAVEDGSASNAAFRKQAKEFVRKLLPSLQKLRAITTKKDKKGDAEDSKLSVVKVQSSGEYAGIYIEESHQTGVAYVSHIAPGSPAEKAGLLRLGDEIIELNDQQIVGWRGKAVLNLLTQCQAPLKFTLKLTTKEFDSRIKVLMEQARAMRESVASHLTPSDQRTSRRMTGDSHPSRSEQRRLTADSRRRTVAEKKQEIEERKSEILRSSIKRDSQTQPPTALSMPAVSPIAVGRGSSQERILKTHLPPALEHGTDCPINIVTPQAEDVWNIGTAYEIQWTSEKSVKAQCLILHLEWETDGQFHRREIANRVLNTGSYTWTITDDLNPGLYQIAIVLPPKGGMQAVQASSMPFQLVNAQQTRTFEAQPARAMEIRTGDSGNFGFATEGRFVSAIYQGGAAHAHGQLHVGDEILELSGMATEGLSTTAIVNLIHASNDKLRITVSNNVVGFKMFLKKLKLLTATYKEALSVKTIDLPACPKGTKGLGLVLDEQGNNIIIQNVLVGSPAAELQCIPHKAFILQANELRIDGSQRHEAVAFLDSKLNNALQLVLSTAQRAVMEYTRGLAALRRECSLTPEQVQEALSRAVATKATLPTVRRTSTSSSGSTHSLKALLSNAGRSLSFSAKPRETPLPADLNMPVSGLNDPDCAGYLTKMGGSGLTPKNWRRRWFVLKCGTVFYYKSPEETTALGAFRLPGYLVMPAGPRKRMATRFGFKVGKPGFRSYYICADDPETMKAWMNAMSLAAIQYEKSDTEKDMEEQFQQQKNIAARSGGFKSFRFHRDASGKRPSRKKKAAMQEETHC